MRLRVGPPVVALLMAGPLLAQPADPAQPDPATLEPLPPAPLESTPTPIEDPPPPSQPEPPPPAAPPAQDSEPAPEPQAAAEPAATDSEDAAALLAELNAELGPQTVSTDTTPSLALYGFADFSFYKYFLNDNAAVRGVLYSQSAFAVGNLNLYFGGELGSGWETLAEVRFSYLPNGSRRVDADGVTRTDTEVTDYTNFGRVRRTGGIFIERAWLQYSIDQLLVLRAGSWLTPYGIWNVDHGSPTIIPVQRPYVIGLELLPERQTGILARGTGYPTEALGVSYALGLSNGRGPVQEYADLDANKAVTARLSATLRTLGVLEFGTTAYYGRYTDLEQSLVPDGAGFRVADEVVEQYDELSLGVDLKYTLGGLHAQAEFIVNERKYTERGRPARTTTTLTPDGRQLGGYLVTGYRFEWLGLMPYVSAEYFSFVNTLEPNMPATQLAAVATAVGINSRPTPNVTLKLEGTRGSFYGDIQAGSSFEHSVTALQSQAAWAF